MTSPLHWKLIPKLALQGKPRTLGGGAASPKRRTADARGALSPLKEA
jgi:hypothetical protein